MTIKDVNPLEAADLRRRAEELLHGSLDSLAAIPQEEARRLLHELQVHQIDLEMQNAELRRTQEELEAAHVKYFDLYDMAPVGYVTVSEKGLILEANLRAAELLGGGRGPLIKQPLHGFIVPEDQDIYYLQRKRLLESGVRQVCELRMQRRDGPPFWARLEMGAALDAEDGLPAHRVTLSDITESKRTQRELSESLELYRAVTQSATDAIVSADSEGNIVGWNRGAETIFGYSEAAVRGRPITLLMPFRFRDSHLASIARMKAGGEPRLTGKVVALEGVRKDGAEFPLELSVAVWQVANSQWYSTTIIRDISDRKRAEDEKRSLERQVQQAQKMESLGMLAGGITHDFNNLLMIALGNAELALDEISPTSTSRERLTAITTTVRRAAELCQQMLTYSGTTSFVRERVELGELVEEMADLLKAAISKKAVLNLDLERGLHLIEADPSQIRQIVMNLIMNASEAIGDRDGVVRVSVGTTQCDGEYLQEAELHGDLAQGLYVHLEVADTGSGMDAETRSHIFEPFFSTKFAGRGLGLSAVLGIVRASKGALKVHGEPGKGTTFKILFPALEGSGEEARTHETSPSADWRGRGTILLVDDEEGLLALGARMLERLGFTVLTAADGRQALDLYRERGKEIDLVLMDLTMPHMDGVEAFGELRRLNPEVRVVLASGYGQGDVGARFTGKGPDGVLQKPYSLAKLRELLAGLMPERSPGEGAISE